MQLIFFACLGFLVISAILFPLLDHLTGRKPLLDLPRLAPVPEFSLPERGGGRLSLEGLRGKVWVADFIFTSCASTCPLMSQQMANLQADLRHFPLDQRERVRLVSFSVDPERDTVQRLAEYAGQFRASPEFWYFVTGEKGEIRKLAQEGFKISAMDNPTPGSGEEILHSSKLVLVDREGFVRGYYDSLQRTDAGTFERLSLGALLRDIRRLLGESPGP